MPDRCAVVIGQLGLQVVEFEREVDGRWIAEVLAIPGAIAYGATKFEALEAAAKVAEMARLGDHPKHSDSTMMGKELV